MPTAESQALPNPLHGVHAAADAEFIPYERLEIVGTFGEPQAEYAGFRKSAALLDEPQRGVLELTGRDRLSFLNNLLTNKTWDKDQKTGMAAGEVVYSYFLNLKGRIVADMNVIELGGRTLIETDVRLVGPLQQAFDKYLFGEQVNLTSRVGTLHRLSLHGPGALGVLQELGGPALFDMKAAAVPALGAGAVVFRDDAAGVPGFHLVVPAAEVVELWARLLRFGTSSELGKRRLRPAGWAAFNACRIEAGRPLFGIDFDGAPVPSAYPARKQREEEAAGGPSAGVLPAETGQLQRAVSFTKGCYLGQEIVARMHARGQVARQIVGIRLETDHLPVAGAPVLDDQSNAVGVITSSTISPLLSNRAICLGYVKKPFMTPGSAVRVPAEGEVRPAAVVPLPFVRPGEFPPPAGQAGARPIGA